MSKYHDINSGEDCAGCRKKMQWVHPDLAKWFWEKKKKYKNLHCSDGWRGPSEQNKLYNEGKSDKPWPKSKHNVTKADQSPCSEAIDLFMINEDGEALWKKEFFKMIYDEAAKNRDPIRWGGHFILRSGARDFPHFEMVR